MAMTQEAKMDFAADVEKVVTVLPDFKYSAELAESKAEEVRCRLEKISTESCEAKGAIETEMQSAREEHEAAELALEKTKASEREAVSELESKVTTLVDVQTELQSVQDEKKKVELESQEDLLRGDELREAKEKNVSVTEEILSSLLQGSEEDEKISSLKNYLQEIGTEKTLVAAADGLRTQPDLRGDFDKMAIDCIRDELSEKLKHLEVKLEENAPVEKQKRAELLGLQALLEILEVKMKVAEQEHKEVTWLQGV